MNPRLPRYWGWRIAWSLAVTQTVGYGVLFYTYGVLIVPMEMELGWTRSQTSGAFSLALLLSGLTAIPVGRIVDRYGARILMTSGSIAGAVLVFAWSFVTSLPALYLVQAGIGLAMSAVLYEVAFTVIANWFRRDRIKAMLVVTFLAGLASTIFIPLATGLVESLGWRPALRILAAVLAIGTVPLHALVLRHKPQQLGLEPDGRPRSEARSTPEESSMGARQALRSPRFWWLSTSFSLDRIAIVAIAAHSVALLLERGHPPALVAAVAGSIGLMQVVGRVLFAPATTRVSLTSLASVTYVVRAVSLLLLLLVPGSVGMWSFAALFGLANGASTLARAGLVAESFGPAHYGSISGTMATLTAVAQTVAPLAVGMLRDRTGGYDIALWTLTGIAVVAAVLVTRGNPIARSAPSPKAE
jgi:MFS family permease